MEGSGFRPHRQSCLTEESRTSTVCFVTENGILKQSEQSHLCTTALSIKDPFNGIFN